MQKTLADIISDTIQGPPDSDPDAYQISGDHYQKMSVQPWHVMEIMLSKEEFIGYMKGCIIKYSMRDGKKEDSDDEGKLRHYIHKLSTIDGKTKINLGIKPKS